MAVSSQPAVIQPDIDYFPDLEKYLARTKRRLESDPSVSRPLPDSFPQKLSSQFVWEGKDLKSSEWTYALNAAEIEEIHQALLSFKSLKKPLGYISQETFPLPTLHPVLRDVSRELHGGRGFKVLRGVPVSRYNDEENVIIYAGISSHIAPLRARQDIFTDGKPVDVVLSHIKDLRSSVYGGRVGAPAYTTDAQVFHTDSGDIVSLYCLSEAASGGTSRVASSWRVYNELAQTRPDIIATLADDWVADTFGKTSAKSFTRPLLYYQPAAGRFNERIVLQYARRNFTGFRTNRRSDDIPPITEAQAEALDALHFLGEKFHIQLDFRKGDIQYINNTAVFHARDAFVDSPDQQRHLTRFWLRDDELSGPPPEELKEVWSRLYSDLDPASEIFPLRPEIRSTSEGASR